MSRTLTAKRKENSSMHRKLRAALVLALLLPTVPRVANANTRPERLIFDGNILFNNAQVAGTPLPYANTAGACTLSTVFTYTTKGLADTFMTHNYTSLDPKLVDPFNTGSPRWDVQQTSPAMSKYAGDAAVMTVPDPWFDQTDYVGAVPAHGESEYNMIAPTLEDSSGINPLPGAYSAFFIRAATAVPSSIRTI